MFYATIKFLLYLPLRILYPTRVKMLAKFPSGKAILVCNHTSLADILILGVCIKRQMYIWGKQELFKNRFYTFILKKLHAIPVNRTNAGISTIKKSLEVLNNDKLLCIFPEGTRKLEEQSNLELKNGVLLIALKANTNIIPAMLLSRPRVFKRNTLLIGEQWDLSQYAGQKISKELLTSLSGTLAEKMQSLKNNFTNNN